MRSTSSPLAVSITIGVLSLAPRSRRMIDSPSSPGIIRSRISRSNRSRIHSRFIDGPPSAVTTAKPLSPR